MVHGILAEFVAKPCRTVPRRSPLVAVPRQSLPVDVPRQPPHKAVVVSEEATEATFVFKEVTEATVIPE